MKHLCFGLVTFFLHIKPDLLILVSGIILVNVSVFNVFLHLIYRKTFLHSSKNT